MRSVKLKAWSKLLWQVTTAQRAYEVESHFCSVCKRLFILISACLEIMLLRAIPLPFTSKCAGDEA